MLFIPDPDPDFLPIPDPGVKKALDPGSATMQFRHLSVLDWVFFFLSNTYNKHEAPSLEKDICRARNLDYST